MFGLGHWEIILILVIVLIVFGAGKLPKVAGELAKGIKSFKRGVALCEGKGMMGENLACKAEFSLILPDEINKYKLK